jgi:hypothetical protein
MGGGRVTTILLGTRRKATSIMRPEGTIQHSPGQRPGSRGKTHSRPQALKGRATLMSPNGAIHPSPGQRPGNQRAITTSSPEGARCRSLNFQEGYPKFLQTYGVKYDERYAGD